MEKPEIGVMPETIWKGRRLADVEDYIYRLMAKRQRLPSHIIEEYNRLIREVQVAEERFKKIITEDREDGEKAQN